MYTAYTDGSCLGNPGPGGWAVIIIDDDHGPVYTYASGGLSFTTNNCMELHAIQIALSLIPEGSEVTIFSDSQYVVKGISEWMPLWKKNGWRKSDKHPVENQDYWMRIDTLIAHLTVKVEWVKAHAKNTLNNQVDSMARNEASKIATH